MRMLPDLLRLNQRLSGRERKRATIMTMTISICIIEMYEVAVMTTQELTDTLAYLAVLRQ
jgi:hypothetical protein